MKTKKVESASTEKAGSSKMTHGEIAERSPLTSLFDRWDSEVPTDTDPEVDVPIDSLESQIGYSSLFRQMHGAFTRQVAYHRSVAGGSLSIEEARAKAFHACLDTEDAKREFETIMRLPVDILNFVDLMELHTAAPRVAEQLWENIKREGQKEFASGHLSANISFPAGYMKQVWNIARYLGVRESFISEWQPKGGIELSLIDMLTQCYFQWQFWLEETVKRSQTRERETHPDYEKWMRDRGEQNRRNGWMEGYWFRPFVSEQQAIDHAVQMADRWNRMYMRTLRQLRDLRRYNPVTINNPGQVNFAPEVANQVSVEAPKPRAAE